jgi:hypothetical protein
MSVSAVLPPPKELVPIEPEVFEAITAVGIAEPYRFLIRSDLSIASQRIGSESPSVNLYQAVFDAGRPLFQTAVDYLGSESLIQIDIDTTPARSGKSQRGNYWHVDGEGIPRPPRIGVVAVSTCLSTQFVTGELPPDSKIILGIERGFIVGGAIDNAISDGSLEVVDTLPFTATAFSRYHVHRGVVNETEEDMPRVFVRAMHW